LQVIPEEFSDAALVILGHGSKKNAESEKPVLQHAAELESRRIFAVVRPAFWKQEPRVVDVLAGLTSPRVFIAPLFISEGYFTDQVIPAELGFRQPGRESIDRVLERGRQQLYYCAPVGTHPSMTRVLLARAQNIVRQYPFPQPPASKETTVFIVGHGTGQNENSRVAVERQAGLLRELEVFADVQAVFLEEDPRVPHCYELARTRNIILVPFFVSDGMHTQEDVPILLGEQERLVRERLAAGRPTWRNPTERRGKLVWYAPGIGSEPLVADVILDSVRQIAAAGPGQRR
jgi:sirohydrochlorin cobaltochelatase